MALPSPADVKAYLRIEQADEDTLVAQLLARAKAAIEAWIGYPFTAAPRTYIDYDGRYPHPGYRWYRTYQLLLPGPFLETGPAPIVTDASGIVVGPTTYYLDGRNGKIIAKSGGMFAGGPYTIVATIGLSAHPEYATQYESIAAMGIIDMVAHLYQNRNPAVESQTDEGGSSVTLSADAVPPRIRQDLLLLPCTRGLIIA